MYYLNLARITLWSAMSSESTDWSLVYQILIVFCCNFDFGIARQGIVLLKNDNNLLPLSVDTINNKNLKVALIGPHANATQNLLSNYHGPNTLVNSHSPMNAISSSVQNIAYAPGCIYINCTNTSGFGEAVSIAKRSNVTIVFLGLCKLFEIFRNFRHL